MTIFKMTAYRIDKIHNKTIEEMWCFPTYDKTIKTQESLEADAEQMAGRITFMINKVAEELNESMFELLEDTMKLENENGENDNCMLCLPKDKERG